MKLFWFETYKTFSRWRTYIGFGAIALIVVLTEVVMKVSAREILQRMMRSLERDFLIFGNVLNVWFITAFIMNSLHIHIPFLITLVAGDMVSSEATSGTVRLLLIRPPFTGQDHYGEIPQHPFLHGRARHLPRVCLRLGRLGPFRQR